MSRRLVATALCVSMLVACSGNDDGGEAPDVGPGAETAEEAVEQLFDRLGDGSFGEAASLAIPQQSALASLAEGASTADVADALDSGDAAIAANFWSGFAQSVDEILARGVSVLGSEGASAEGTEFTLVEIDAGSGAPRHIATRDVDGYRVDLFATFGPALASRLYPQVERLFQDPSEDASRVLGGLRDQVPSLYIASETPGLAPNLVQDLLQLIELITRIN